MRAQAAATSVELFHEDTRLAVVLAEISTDYFAEAFRTDPLRAVNVGIMEQTMVGVAAGMAMEGFHPIVHTIAPFLAERALEQVKLDLGNQELAATLIGTGGSYDYATEGTTHHSPADVAALMTVPGLEVHVPGHPDEVDRLLRAILGGDRLSYVRTQARANALAQPVEPGRILPLRRGPRGTILAVGPMLDAALPVAERLDATLLYAITVAPLDAGTLAREMADAPGLVVVEPFQEGTLAAAVTAALPHRAVRLLSVGVPRRPFRAYGTPEDLDRIAGLDPAAIEARIGAFLDRR